MVRVGNKINMPTNNNKKMITKEKTTLHLNNSAKTSLRTTVPKFIVQFFDLEKGGMVEWNLQTIRGQKVAVVRRID